MWAGESRVFSKENLLLWKVSILNCWFFSPLFLIQISKVTHGCSHLQPMLCFSQRLQSSKFCWSLRMNELHGEQVSPCNGFLSFPGFFWACPCPSVSNSSLYPSFGSFWSQIIYVTFRLCMKLEVNGFVFLAPLHGAEAFCDCLSTQNTSAAHYSKTSEGLIFCP